MRYLLPYVLLGLTGCTAHFAYDLFGKKKWMAPFLPVNESVWEHTKLLLFPALLISFIEYLIFPGSFCWQGRFLGIICGMAFMIAGYYTYSGVIGKGILWADILLFYLSAAVYYLTSRIHCGPIWGYILAVIIILTVTFTFRPPHLPLFKDQKSGKYGVE